MKSQILTGKLMHKRQKPKYHAFTFSYYWLVIYLDELPELDKHIVGFSHNRKNVMSIHDSDYLGNDRRPIKDKLFDVLKKKPYVNNISSMILLTSPRYLNKAFNPVNFFYCYAEDGALVCVVVEVNNTFKESHLYILNDVESTPGKFAVKYSNSKEFYVSPFNTLEGYYDFLLSHLNKEVDIRINLMVNKAPHIVTQLWGNCRSLTSTSLFLTALRFPISGLMTLSMITFHAILLRLKGVPPVLKPKPTHPMTYLRNNK